MKKAHLSPQVVIVEASAGSGKTYALARRYLELLLKARLKPGELPLKTILAITFTNKAALEMKERIFYFLKRLALDSFDSEDEKRQILEALGVGEEEARRRAQESMDALLRNYNFFQVQTIDSFINAILSGCAFKLGLSAHFTTERDHAEYIAWSLDGLIDRAAHDAALQELFLSFLRQYLHIEHKTGWFPKRSILDQMARLFTRSNVFDGSFVRARLDASSLLERKAALLEKMRRLATFLPEGTYVRFRTALAGFLERNRRSFSIDAVSSYFGAESPPVKKGTACSVKLKRAWGSIREGLGAVCELESACVFNSYVDIFNLLLRDMRELSSREDVLFLESLNKQARSLFSQDAVSLPELYYRLATRFRHFLIDEFQDTSRLQWKNLAPMAQEALATGGSLFYVGDRKQAIYRFRGGDVSLMDEVGRGFEAYTCVRSSLNTNYRSLREVVEYNNRVFSEENLRLFLQKREDTLKGGLSLNREDTEYIVGVFRGSRQETRSGTEGGYVRVRYLDCASRDELYDAVRAHVVGIVRQLTGRLSAQDLAFLVRTNDEVELLTGWLLEEGIPVASEKTLNIRQNPYIKELISFLSFLHSPIDNLAFVSFILGDIFQAVSGIPRERLCDFVFSLDLRRQGRTYVYREFRCRFPEAWDSLIEEFFRSVGYVPLYELLVSIFGRWQVLERFSDYQGFFMRLLELVASEEEKLTGIGAFLEQFDSPGQEDIYVNAANSRAVRILTIHKAKGLEFRAVVVPFLQMNVKPDTLVVLAAEEELRLVRLKKKYNEFSGALEELYRQEYIKAFIDELDSLYVALTRAQEELYILVPSRADHGANPGALLLPANDDEKGLLPGAAEQPASGGLMRPITPAAYRDWVEFLEDEFSRQSVLTNRTAIASGELMHYLLSCVGNLHGLDAQEVIAEARQRAALEFPFAEELQECVQRVEQVVNSPELAPYFDLPGAEVYTEKEIVDARGETFRLDRLIVTGTEAVVVDYKSSEAAEAEQQKQVRRYMGLVGQLYPRHRVRGVLIYLDTGKVEEIK